MDPDKVGHNKNEEEALTSITLPIEDCTFLISLRDSTNLTAFMDILRSTHIQSNWPVTVISYWMRCLVWHYL